MDLTELKVLPHALYLKMYAEHFQNHPEPPPIFYIQNCACAGNIFFSEHLRGVCGKRMINGPEGVKIYPHPLLCAHNRQFLVMPAERRLYFVVRETFEEIEKMVDEMRNSFGMRIAEEPRLNRLLLAHFGYNCKGIRMPIFELIVAIERIMWPELNFIRDFRIVIRDPMLYEKIFFVIEKAKRTGAFASHLSCVPI